MPKHFIMNYCPICGDSVEQSVILNISQPHTGWVVFCQSGAFCHTLSSKDGIERLVYMALSPTLSNEKQERESGQIPLL